MAHPHPGLDVCDTGRKLYVKALRSGRIARSATEAAPCLVDTDLVRPDDDAQWFVPAPPAVTVARLFHSVERGMDDYRSFVTSVADALTQPPSPSPDDTAAPSTRTWSGKLRINALIVRVLEDCTAELLTAQPMQNRPEWAFRSAVPVVLPLLERGVRVRTLYNHTARHNPSALDYVTRVQHADMEVRTLEENIERLIVVDREVAFVPAQADREVALEIRHPGIIWYLVNVFESFWRIATPWEQEVPYQVTPEGITGVQLSIARLLVEGHLDEAIARRLGMNVRTCRAHIAKLSAALGSSSRTQLGYLIAQSGLCEPS